MDVHIYEVGSTVRATDAQALLSPQILKQIVKAVMEQMHAEQAHEQCIANERRLHGSALANHRQDWR